MATLKQLRDKIYDAQIEARRFWRLACEHDMIDPESKFVVLSKDNPFAKQVNAANGEVLRLQRAYAAQEKRNKARRDRHAAYTDLGLKRVKGALGTVFYE